MSDRSPQVGLVDGNFDGNPNGKGTTYAHVSTVGD